MHLDRLVLVFAVCLVPLALSGCLEDKVLDIVVTGETYADFSQDEISPDWSTGAYIDVAQQVRDILEANGYSDNDLRDAHITSVHYGVSSFSQAHDWTISGSIKVVYKGNTQTIVNYASQSVQAALGQKIPATLETAGVDLVNAALKDFVAGENPVLAFIVDNATTTPVPSEVDDMVFDWRAWLAIQIILKQTIKDVPDPF